MYDLRDVSAGQRRGQCALLGQGRISKKEGEQRSPVDFRRAESSSLITTTRQQPDADNGAQLKHCLQVLLAFSLFSFCSCSNATLAARLSIADGPRMPRLAPGWPFFPATRASCTFCECRSAPRIDCGSHALLPSPPASPTTHIHVYGMAARESRCDCRSLSPRCPATSRNCQTASKPAAKPKLGRHARALSAARFSSQPRLPISRTARNWQLAATPGRVACVAALASAPAACLPAIHPSARRGDANQNHPTSQWQK